MIVHKSRQILKFIVHYTDRLKYTVHHIHRLYTDAVHNTCLSNIVWYVNLFIFRLVDCSLINAVLKRNIHSF